MNDKPTFGELLDALVLAAYADGLYGADEWSHALVQAQLAVTDRLCELGFVEVNGHAH